MGEGGGGAAIGVGFLSVRPRHSCVAARAASAGSLSVDCRARRAGVSADAGCGMCVGRCERACTRLPECRTEAGAMFCSIGRSMSIWTIGFHFFLYSYGKP